MFVGTYYGRYYGDYFGPQEVAFVDVVFGKAWLDYPTGAIELAHAFAMLDVEVQAQVARAIGLVNVIAPQGAIDLARGYAIVEVEAEPAEDE